MLVKNEEGLQITTPTDLEIVTTRVFNAPRRLVFDAWTRPEHLVQWWGCDSSTLPVCEVDLRVGGNYRFILRMPEGDFTFSGTYREIAPPGRLVYTQRFDGAPDAEALVTMTLTEQNGKTLYSETILHQTRENRDAHLASGMESGAAQTLDRLAALLGRLS